MKTKLLVNSFTIPICALMLACVTNIRAADGTWTNTGGGNWSDPLNWSGGVIADGVDDNVFFNTLDIVTNLSIVNPITVTIDDMVRTNSTLIFSDLDTNTPASWLLQGAGLTIFNNLSVIVTNLAVGESATISAPLADAGNPGSVTKLGDGTLILTGGNSYSGGTIVSNGTLQVNADTGLGAAGTSLNLQGGTFFNNGSITLATRPITFGANNVTWNQGGSASANSGGDITGIISSSGNGTVFKTGAGNLRFGSDSGVNGLFTNPIVILGGSLQAVGNNNMCPFGFGTITISNNLSSIYGASSGNNVFISNNIVIPAGITLNFDGVGGGGSSQSTGLGLFGNISGAGNMQKGGGGNGTFGGDNSGFTGTFTGNNSGAGNFSYRNPNAGSASATWIFNNSTKTSNTHANQAELGDVGGIIRFGSIGGTGTQPLTKNTDAGNVIYEIGALGNNDTINFNITKSASGGTLGINKVGTGTLTLGGTANTYDGPTTISNGVLVVNSETSLGALPGSFNPAQLTLDGGVFSNSVSLTLNNDNRGITLGAGSVLGGGIFSPGAGTVLTVSNVITGGGSLTLANSTGILSLNGVNTYTGKTIVSSGVLSIDAENELGNAPGGFTADQLTINGGTVSNRVALTINNVTRGITIGASGGNIDTSGGTLTIGSPIAGTSGTLTKIGTGTLSLTAPNPITATTFISSGTLALGVSGTLASSIISVASGATYDVSAVSGYSSANGQTLNGNGTVLGNPNINAGGTVSAGNNNIGQINFNGNVTFNGGTDYVDINSATNDMVAITGNLMLSGTSTIQLNVQSDLASGRHVIMTYSGTLGGGGNFVLVNAPAGTTVDTSVAHEVAIVLNIVVQNLTWKGDGTANNWDSTSLNWSNGVTLVQFNNGDNTTFSDTGSESPQVNLTGAESPSTVTVNATGNYTFGGAGKITGVGAVTKTSSGTLTLLTANDYSGGTLISQGTVQVGNGTTSGAVGSGDVTDNSTLNFNSPAGVTNAGALHGSGSLNVQGGKVALTGNGDFAGGTTISSGATLQIGAGGSSGALGGGTVSDSGTLLWNRTGTVTNSSLISGAGSLLLSNSVTVALTGNSTGYSGPVTIDTGVLQLGAGGTSGTIGVSSVTLANNGGLAFSRSDTLTNGISLTGNGQLIQQGPGTVILTNLIANNGSTIINGGTLQIGDGNADGTLAGGVITDSGVLAFNRPDAYTITNRITGGGIVSVFGGGTNTLNAPSPYNSYSGGTLISNATVIVGTDTDVSSLLGDAGSGAVTLYNGGTLKMANADNLATSSTIYWEFANGITVPTGQTGTVLAARDMRAGTGFHGAVSGGGTLNFRVNGPREEISGDWSGFTGTLNIITNAGTIDANNFNTIANIANATINIGDGAHLGVWAETGNLHANSTITLGGISGTGQLGSSTESQTANGATFVVGSANLTNEFDGVIANEGSGTTSLQKVGTGTWILTGSSTYSGSTTISNGVLSLTNNPVTTVDANISSSPTITIVSPGILDVSGLLNTPAELQLNGTLQGNGTVIGGISDNGTIAPGLSTNIFGNLTVSSNVTVNGSVNIKIDRNGNALFSDKLTAPVVYANYGTLNITEVSTNDLHTGDTFTLFSVPVTGNGFGSINITPSTTLDGSITYGWDLSQLAVNGTIVLTNGAAVTVNTSPTNILTTVSGNTLTLTWPEDHTGWGLQVQTNSLSTGLGANWQDVPGSSSINSTNITINPVNGSVFYRLIYPPNVP